MGDSSYGKFDKRIYTILASDHPHRSLPLSGRELLHGRAGLINSGGASGANDFEEAVVTAASTNALAAQVSSPGAKLPAPHGLRG